MRLFKSVVSKNALLNMAQGWLKFTPLNELNDPSELTPVMDRAVIAEKSGHFIIIDRPDVVIDAITQVVQSVRKNAKF
jgi:hypothetical protein